MSHEWQPWGLPPGPSDATTPHSNILRPQGLGEKEKLGYLCVSGHGDCKGRCQEPWLSPKKGASRPHKVTGQGTLGGASGPSTPQGLPGTQERKWLWVSECAEKGQKETLVSPPEAKPAVEKEPLATDKQKPAAGHHHRDRHTNA